MLRPYKVFGFALSESIVCQAFVTSIVAEIIEKAFAHFGSFRVAVNITEGV